MKEYFKDSKLIRVSDTMILRDKDIRYVYMNEKETGLFKKEKYLEIKYELMDGTTLTSLKTTEKEALDVMNKIAEMR
jgi:hypothetical protein